jgi:mannose-6-phosphate isomerase class I
LRPGAGHEEIVLTISGGLQLEGQGGNLTLQAGQALYIKGEETWQATCLGPLEARYAVAGGHTPGDDHHH